MSAKMTYTNDFCRSTEISRKVGGRERSWLLQNEFPKSSVEQFLKRAVESSSPCSLSTYMVLSVLKPRHFMGPLIKVIFNDGDHTFMANSWGKDKKAVQAFLALRGRFDAPVSQILRHCPKLFQNQTFSDFLKALEATLPGHCSPLDVSIAGARFTAAQPELIDLSRKEPLILSSKREEAVILPAAIKKLMKKLRDHRKEGVPIFLEEACTDAERTGLDDFGKLCVAIIKAVYARTEGGFVAGERIAQAGLALVTKLHEGQKPSELAAPYLEALRTIKGIAPIFEEVSPKKKKAGPRPFALTGIDGYFSLYGLTEDPAKLWNDLTGLIKRVYLDILFFCGRRACCLLLLTLGDFVKAVNPVTGQNVLDVTIRFSKGGRAAPLPLPLSSLLPDSELKLVERFLELTSNLPRGIFLFSLLSDKDFPQRNTDAFAQFLRATLLPDGVESLHIPRIVFASVWPLRVMCARNRLLLEHDILKDIRRNVMFSGEMLDKMLKIVQGDELDSLEMARRVMGHASTFEFIFDYCRSWGIQTLLAAQHD